MEDHLSTYTKKRLISEERKLLKNLKYEAKARNKGRTKDEKQRILFFSVLDTKVRKWLIRQLEGKKRLKIVEKITK